MEGKAATGWALRRQLQSWKRLGHQGWNTNTEDYLVRPWTHVKNIEFETENNARKLLPSARKLLNLFETIILSIKWE